MATQDEIKQLAARSVTDPGFRAVLVADPAAAAAQMGIQLTPDQVAGLQKAAQGIAVSGQMLDDRLGKVASLVAGVWI